MALRHPAAVLLAAAALLLAPSLVLGTLISHSSPHNLTWAAQFADRFAPGIAYPRWSPDSFDGLGGPTFYFYPPMAFWVDAVLSAVTLDALSVSHRLSVASLLLLWASGLAMHAWLKAEAVPPRTVLCGALAYMAAPYHLLDHYYRGAFAEFAAYAVLPFIMLAISRIAGRQRFGALLLAVAYAALPMTHLPTSLLISVTVLPMYVLYRGGRLGAVGPAVGFFVRCALGGALGLGLAAIYLIPALTLQDWIPSDAFWTGSYLIEKWLLLTSDLGLQLSGMIGLITWSSVAYGIASIGVIVVMLRRGGPEGGRSEAVFWAFVCIVCVLLIVGVVPWFWRAPFVNQVQFPWRLMIVVEFAAVTALCLVPWPVRSRAQASIFVAAVLALVPGVVELGDGIRVRVQVSLANPSLPGDLKQFLPARFPQKPNAGYADLSLEPLAGVPTVACAPEPRSCRSAKLPFGDLSIEVDADVPTAVVVRRFFFPVWRLDPALPVAATDPLQLVTFTAPPGEHSFRLHRVAVPAEKWGWAISGLSLVLLLVWTTWEWRIRRP